MNAKRKTVKLSTIIRSWRS